MVLSSFSFIAPIYMRLEVYSQGPAHFASSVGSGDEAARFIRRPHQHRGNAKCERGKTEIDHESSDQFRLLRPLGEESFHNKRRRKQP
jgi:hypothetical protein